MTEPTKRLTIGQRVNAITSQVGQVRATGKNAQGVIALSNEDIEDSLRPLFAQFGVIARWTTVKGESYQEPTRNGTMTLWRLDFKVRIEADDQPDEGFDADWFDIGGSPAAAESFAVKGYYKRLFHIASADDEKQQPRERENRRQAQQEAVPDDGYAGTPEPTTAKPPVDPLAGLPAGFTAPQWDDLKKLASDTKKRVGVESWNAFAYNTPTLLKAHATELAATTGAPDATDESKSAYAYETIRGELGALEPPKSPDGLDKRPGAFSVAAVEAQKPFDPQDEDALRAAVVSSA